MATNTSTQKLVNELEKAVDSSKKLLKVFEETEEVTKDIAKELQDAFKGIDKKTSKGITEFNKALKETNKLVEDSEKLQQSKIKTEIELHKLEQTRTRTHIQSRKETERRLKLAKKERTEQDKEVKALKQANREYTKQSKILNETRNSYKDLFLETEKNRKGFKGLFFGFTKTGKALKKLKKETEDYDEKLKDLDESVGQNQRSVGKYEKAVKGLNSVLGKLGIIAVVTKGFELLQNAFGSTINGSNAMKKAMNGITATVAETGKRLGQIATEVSNIFSREGAWYQGIININDAMGELFSGKNWDKFDDDVARRVTEMNKLVDVSTTYRKEIESLTREITAHNTVMRTQLQIAENDKISFETRIIASNKAIVSAEKLTKAEAKRSAKKLELAAKEIAIDIKLDRNKSESLKNYVARLNKALSDEETLRTTSHEKNEAFTQAQEEFEAQKLESIDIYSDVLEKQLMLYSDHNELIIDLDLDLLDNIKTRNEKLIASEKETFEERKKILEDTKTAFDKGFRLQAETIVKQGQRVYDAELKILELQKQRGLLNSKDFEARKKEIEQKRAILTVAKLEEIANLKTAEARAKALKQLEIAEKFTLRNSEVIRDYTTGKQDLTDATNDLTDAQKEEAETQTKIMEQQKVLSGDTSIETYEEGQLERDILAAEKRRDLTIENTAERTKAQFELNELLLEQQKTAEDKLDDIAEKRAETRKKIVEDGVTVIDSILSKSRDKQNSEVEAELDALDSRIDSVNNAIENGNAGASESLAELEKQKEQAEKRQEDIRKKEIRDQKIIAGLQLLSANDGNVGKTLGDVSTLIAGLSQLDSFFDGTEDTGTVQNPLDSNGGRTAILHDNERVMTAKQNAKIGGISNEDLADLGAMHNSGNLNGGTTIIQTNNDKLISEVKEIVNAVKSIPVQSYNYDAKSKYHEQVLTTKNKREIIKVKANNLFK